MNYNDIADVNKRLYNGNISQTYWRTANIDNSLKNYEYRYDALNRITGAVDNTTNYNLANVSYDKNGNITNLAREGHLTTAATTFGPMDNLSYYYSGNQLHSVTDSSGKTTGFNDGNSSDTVYDNGNDDYKYDTNGNLIKDLNKGIGTSSTNGITYNHLNLPIEIKFDNSSTKKINYTYDATGVKLQKVVNDGGNLTTTDYAGNYIYENNILQFFNHAEGYTTPDGSGGFDYVYQYLDHLGNIRISYSDSDGNGSVSTSEIIEESNYYPFGLEHKGYNNVVNGTENKYQTFQGQELEEELGKNTLAFQWRDYDPAIARFNKIDRFAEKYNRISPYSFTANNPIFFNEIKGDSINITLIQRYDTANGTNYAQNIISDLNEQTGMTFEVNDNGQLTYQVDSNGNAVVSTTTDSNGNTTQNGSAEARTMMTHAVSTTDQAYVKITTTGNSGVRGTGSPLIQLNPNQINSFVTGANNVNSKTQGWGMTLMHEAQHSNVAEGGANSHGSEKANFGQTGTIVDRMNIVRRQMNSQGKNYGIRTSYQGLYFNPTSKKPIYVPYGSSSRNQMNAGNPPSTSTMFIQFN